MGLEKGAGTFPFKQLHLAHDNLLENYSNSFQRLLYDVYETNFTIFLTKKWLMRLPISLKRRQMSMNHYEMDCVLWLPTPNNWFIGENGLLQMGGSRLVPFVSLT